MRLMAGGTKKGYGQEPRESLEDFNILAIESHRVLGRYSGYHADHAALRFQWKGDTVNSSMAALRRMEFGHNPGDTGGRFPALPDDIG
ncbi:hypothetical protein KKH27_06110 [bacterium]|nr:hypothetical protein [bacterium]